MLSENEIPLERISAKFSELGIQIEQSTIWSTIEQYILADQLGARLHGDILIRD